MSIPVWWSYLSYHAKMLSIRLVVLTMPSWWLISFHPNPAQRRTSTRCLQFASPHNFFSMGLPPQQQMWNLLPVCSKTTPRQFCLHSGKKKPTKAGFVLEDPTRANYPKLTDDVANLKVRKIVFQSNDSPEGHPAPDPVLLVTKSISSASISWSE